MRHSAYDYIFQNEKSHWWYRVRRNIVHDLVQDLKPQLPTPANILDIGCGMGQLMTELNKYGNVSGIDVSEHSVEYCKARGLLDVKLGDGVNLPYEDNSFDLVLALDVIEHIEDDSKALSEMQRILKPGGRLIIFVPCFNFLWGMSDLVGKHYRRYTLDELHQKTENAKFSIIRSSYFNFFLFPLVFAVRLLTRYLVKKPKLEYENTSNRFLNALLFNVFNYESKLLKIMKFPFGVSGLIVCKKRVALESAD